MKTKILAALLAASALLLVITFLASNRVNAETLPSSDITVKVLGSPVFVDPIRSVYSIGSAQTQLISDCTNPIKAYIQRLIITNKSTANDLCVYMVNAGASCGSTVTCNITLGQTTGDLILPMSVKPWDIPCSKRLCGVASATSTVVHVSRAEVP